jgi:hypothetical protein
LPGISLDLDAQDRWQRVAGEPTVKVDGIEELVTDKGYYSGAVVERVKSYEVRSYIPEKQPKGQRNRQGKAAEQRAGLRE